MLISDLYKNGVKLLDGAGIPDAGLEVSLLLAFILNKSRTNIYLTASETVSEETKTRFEKVLAQRLKRTPLAYITGEQEFWSLPFSVTPDVLIPRPETEQMLEMVLACVKDSVFRIEKILDLGTGSGAIAIVLAREIDNALVVAVDRSIAALKITKQNINKHNLSKRVHCLCSDWGKAVQNEQWDLIVSNPPYIASDVMASLDPEVQKEPGIALDGGVCGIEAISVLVAQLEGLLKPGGWFFMEIGYDQEDAVGNLFSSLPFFNDIAVRRDHAGLPRVLRARRTN